MPDPRSQIRITEETLLVVAAIAHLGEATPVQIRARTGVASGTLTPILRRLEAAKWVERRKSGPYWITNLPAVGRMAKRLEMVVQDILEGVSL